MAMNFNRAYRTEVLSLGDNIGLFSGIQPPTTFDTSTFPVGSVYFQTDGTMWKRKGMGPSDWVRMITEDSALLTGVAQNIQSGDYTLLLSDAGKQILHPAEDHAARTFTIPAKPRP